MTAFSLFEQDPAAARIRQAADREALPHALLITGGSGAPAAARFAAAAMECTAEHGRPCGRCSGCRKVLGNIHPDVIEVRDPDHKQLPVELIRDVRADAYIRPNEGRRKVYIFPDCGVLSEAGQNVLLKIVEEGPPYAAFLFCADHPGQVLRTLRSRCVELKLHPEPGEETEGKSGELAEDFCRALAARRRGAVTEAAVQLERQKLKRDELAPVLEQVWVCCTEALLLRYGRPDRGSCGNCAALLAKTLTKNQIMRTIETLKTYHEECTCNVGVGHVLGALAAELEGIL